MATCAAVIALLSLVVTIAQVRATQTHNRKSVRPVLQMDTSFHPGGQAGLLLSNVGLGPARIVSSRLQVDERVLGSSARTRSTRSAPICSVARGQRHSGPAPSLPSTTCGSCSAWTTTIPTATRSSRISCATGSCSSSSTSRSTVANGSCCAIPRGNPTRDPHERATAANARSRARRRGARGELPRTDSHELR